MQPPCNHFFSCFPRPTQTQNKSLQVRGSVLLTHTLHVSPASSSPGSISPPSPGTQQSPSTSKHLSAPRSPPGLNQNERKRRSAAAVCGCNTRGGCCTAPCGQAMLRSQPSLLSAARQGSGTAAVANAPLAQPASFPAPEGRWNPLVSGQLCHSEQNPTFVANGAQHRPQRKLSCQSWLPQRMH